MSLKLSILNRNTLTEIYFTRKFLKREFMKLVTAWFPDFSVPSPPKKNSKIKKTVNFFDKINKNLKPKTGLVLIRFENNFLVGEYGN